MKPVLIVLSLVVLCLAAAYGVPQYRLNRENARRQRGIQKERLIEDRTPLVLDAKTQAIFAGADRVETFRLVGGSDEDYPKEDQAALSKTQYFDDYPVLHAGSRQGKAFAASLQKALCQASAVTNGAQCFSPGVGFRVWKAKAHVDTCICFYCSGIQITTPGTSSESVRQNPLHLPTMLGESRMALLALSKQAFPQDTQPARLN